MHTFLPIVDHYPVSCAGAFESEPGEEAVILQNLIKMTGDASGAAMAPVDAAQLSPSAGAGESTGPSHSLILVTLRHRLSEDNLSFYEGVIV